MNASSAASRLRQRRLRPGFYQTHLKRPLDVILTVFILVFTAPLMAVIALLIRMDSPGPIFFTQLRVGRHGKRIKVSRFRCLRVDSAAWNHTLLHVVSDWDWKSRDMTPIGRRLLYYRLDRLPQLLSVLTGDMSLVGPRPPLPAELSRYGYGDWIRMRCRPGLTCLWQISGLPESDFAASMALDQQYFDHVSLLLDLRILIRSAVAVAGGRALH